MWKKYGKQAVKIIISSWLLLCVAGFFKDMLGISFEVKVPECASKDITKTELIHLIDNMPLMQENSVTALYVDNASQLAYNENKQTRTCTAVVKLSNTELAGIKYEMYLREKEVYIELEFTDEDDDKDSSCPDGSSPVIPMMISGEAIYPDNIDPETGCEIPDDEL